MIGGLTNHLWQSTLFAIATGLLAIAFSKSRAQVRYWLWLSASFKFLIPFTLLMSLGSHGAWAPAAHEIVTRLASPSVSSTMVQISRPFPDTLPLAASTRGTRDLALIAILGMWACGFSGMAAMRFRDGLRIRAAVRASTPMEIPAAVEVRSSPGLLEPAVAGLLRPILLLPANIIQRLTPRQLEAVLLHELCHVRRRDNLTAAMHMLVEAVFWFHPLVWSISARLVAERERACDEEVLRLGTEPEIYAQGILNVCISYLEPPLSSVSGVTGSNVKERLQLILTGRVPCDLDFGKKVALAVAATTALALPIVVGVIDAPMLRAQPAQSKVVAGPKVEVSIRTARDCDGSGRATESGGPSTYESSTPGTLLARCETIATLIQAVYGVSADDRINQTGGPAWLNSERYTIRAAGSVPGSQLRPMLQALLEDRLKLKIHHTTRQMPVYVLTVAKAGPKLKQFEEGGCTPMTLPTASQLYRNEDKLKPGQKPGCYRATLVNGPKGALDIRPATLDEFSHHLEGVLGRPVINQTRIAGMFDLYVEFAIDRGTPGLMSGPDALQPAPLSDTPGGGSIFTALQDQLGLKLESTTGPGDLIVIDRVERPEDQ
jgi:bla regulator protein BlaR1